MNPEYAVARLEALLDGYARVAVAVSGGVDSMTLASITARHHGIAATMIHAVSPAVPLAATRRVKQYAARFDWDLDIIDAGEFGDPRYRKNPANRCFFCKSNLYGAMASRTQAQLLSGTNLDDLQDWRPGLAAAKDNNVAHPFVDCEIGKTTVRAMARLLGLDDLAELPAAPCLSSRVETGIAIEPTTLTAIDQVETELRQTLAPQTVRCRVRSGGVVVELDRETFTALDDLDRNHVLGCVSRAFADERAGRARIVPYERGSAFLRGAADQ